MAPTTIRLLFALAVAIIAAAIADPLLEGASNAGIFGPGSFTDHSNLDVVPAVIAGVMLLAVHVGFKARGMLLRESSRALETGTSRLLPAAFAIQLLVLYVMETSEQFVTLGHTLGGTVWLGAPVIVSFIVHAITCVLVATVLARAVRTLAKAAVRIVRLVRALAARPAQPPRPVFGRDVDLAVFARYRPVLGRIGERAPPLL